MKEDNNKLVPESMGETQAKPLSKVEQIEKAIEEMNARNGWTCSKGKPQKCTIMFVKY